MTAPLPWRDALEAAIRILREGRMPPRHKIERILNTLDAMALAEAQGAGVVIVQKPTQFHRQEA